MQTTIHKSVPHLVAPPRALVGFDVEAVRVPSERSFAARVAQHPQFGLLASRLVPGDPKEIRRRLMAQSLRLSDSMAPDAYRSARAAQQVLGIEGDIEIFQRSGAENAAIHLVDAPILLEVQGPILSLLDEPTLHGVFGHELGHYVAHGPKSPLRGPLSLTSVLGRVELDRPLEQTLSRLSMVAELTADRIGLLACQDLHTMLRLEMVTLTGLSSGALTWDTESYLAQSRDLMEAELAAGGGFFGRTHPEHNLRSYALWLFSETTTFKRLTGRGPGTREIAEVDAILARFFGDEEQGSVELVLDYSRLGEPPRELHECALAAAVIVAHADEEVTEEEVSAIERIFAPLVPDWRSYLDFEIALERFHELAPVLVAAGPDLVRSLFQLLVHVMGADNQVDAREVRVILTIGKAMGAEPLFRQWLASTLAALEVPLPLEETTPHDLPLPARRDDVADAFETFLRGVTRRGVSETTLRRLLRLIGKDRRSPDAVAKVQSLLRGRRIETAADLTSVGLDEKVKLVAPASPASTSEPRPSREPAGERGVLVAALRRLREQLVSGDGRSPSVRLRQARRGRAFDLMDLERVSVGLAERVLAQVRAGKAVRLIDAASAGKHASSATAAVELLALAREDAGRFEETGAHDLFVGYPFLTGVIEGYPVRAPLVLYPVQIEREGAGAQGFKLRPRQDEPAIANQSLIRLIFNKRGFVYSDELSDQLEELAGDGDGGPDAVRRRLAEVGLASSHTGGALVPLSDRDVELSERGAFLEVEECAVLGLFPQSSSDLLQDYDGLLQELTQSKVDVSQLLASAAVLLPDEMTGTFSAPASAAEPLVAPVIAADPTQRHVIAECRRHRATVVDGPPGTGKSQVIVNLVAEALSRGERVAVVCEKRAALDVVRQRLGSLGFEKVLAVVHDVQEDRKSLFELISKRIEETEPSPFDANAAMQTVAEHAGVERSIDARSVALRRRPAGLDLCVGELMTLISSTPSTPLAVPGLGSLEQRKLRELLDVTSDLQPMSDLWSVSSPWRTPHGAPLRQSFANLDARGLREMTRQLEECLAVASTYAAMALSSPVHVDHIEGARGALAHAIEARSMRTDPVDREVFRSLLPAATQAPERLAATDAVRTAWETSSAAITKLRQPVQIDASNEMVASISVLRAWSRSWVRFFVLGWWLARFALRRELARVWPEKAGDDLTPAFLDDLADRIAASRGWRALGAAFDGLAVRHLLPASSDALEPTVHRLVRIGPAVQDLARTRNALSLAAVWPGDFVTADGGLQRWEDALDARARLLETRDLLARAAAPLHRAFPWIGPLPSVTAVAAVLEAWTRDGHRLAETDALLTRASSLLPGAPMLLDALASAHPTNDAAVWRSATISAWAISWLARMEQESTGIASLGTTTDDRDLERSAGRLAELEEELRELEIERTLHRVDDAGLLRTAVAEKHQRRSPAQKVREELLKETRKKRRLMPLRSFVRRFAPSGLLGVLPVWLLSPETMAILFPRQPLFDLVVFDEASQCTVEAGLPVLLRAKRVVIAGDEKQMPPTSYFRLGSGDGDETADQDEQRREIQDILSSESLLTLARARCAHAGLAWHYRCRDEALIAFSNHALYDASLLTIPSIASHESTSPLRWISVPDGEYDDGVNKREAERVVDLVHELLCRAPRPSVGVITFNLRQRKAVLDAIEARCAKDDHFQACWSEASTHQSMDERPFVKNLEQVQGDERDAVVFSLGHSPQERRKKGSNATERYVPARFGPLGQRGGERRLNVAISRAKSECTIVASFEPQQLSVASALHEGPRLFKQFLEFAHHTHHGRRLEAKRILTLVRESSRARAPQPPRLPIEGYLPLSSQLSLALEAARIPHEVDVGASTFRVPVAILDPRDPARYVLAILIDDATSDATAFDLHVHRRAVLRTRGWKVLSISAASWYRRSASILAEIEAAVPGARGALDTAVFAQHRNARARPAALSPQPQSQAERRELVVATAEPPAPAAEEVPPWATAIEDRLFQRALVHLARHGHLGEAELTNMVGGPRRARQFARDLEGLRERLPFRVEVQDVSGSKVYRAVGAK